MRRRGLALALAIAMGAGGAGASSHDEEFDDLTAMNLEDLMDLEVDYGECLLDDDFSAGLARLLEGDAWRARGEAARAFVRGTFGADVAIARHIAVYRALLGAGGTERAASPSRLGLTSQGIVRPGGSA